jgi:hypothetical protein
MEVLAKRDAVVFPGDCLELVGTIPDAAIQLVRI